MVPTNALRAQIDAKLAAIRQAGDPVTLEELMRWLPAVPDAENQALLLTNAFAACVYVKDVPDIPARSVRLPTLTKRWFEYEVKTNQVALQRLREAAKLKQSRYPADWTRGWETDLPHLTKVKSLTQLLQREAALHTENRRLDQAVDSITTIISVARSLDQEPCLVSQFVRGVILFYARQATERLVNQTRLTEAQLSVLQDLFRRSQEREPFTRALVGHRSDGLDLLHQPREKIVSLLEMLYLGEAKTNQIPALASVFEKNKDADCLFYLDAMDSLITASKLPEHWKSLELVRAVAARLQTELNQPTEERLVISTTSLADWPLDGDATPSPVKIFTKLVRSVAHMRTTEVALAVERFRLAHQGQLPSDLDALTSEFLPAVLADPFDGRPLRYVLLAKGYVVYSIGADGQDNGGKEADRKSSIGEGGTDITFTVER